ncbi:hypothetical protein BG006_002300 [Podila minutissima]|uniref:DUF7330 domain-containing protein n=1 Tax=Podila minutissima TaxID=64525 RepID=A0A9P5SNX2_9FUNG|nr:hypothetical protein BG006_002300 [Podila minutissima]
MTCSNSGSAFEPVCCVHTPEGNPEARPLLGHHSHSRSQQPINTTSTCNEKGLPTPVQDGDRACKAAKMKKNQKLVKKLAALLLLGYLFFNYILPSYHNHNSPHRGRHHVIVDSNDMDNTSSKDTIYHGDECKTYAVEWDGPSVFSTTSERLHLSFGKGNLVSKVTVQTAAVNEPTLKLTAYASPEDEDNDGHDLSLLPVPGEKYTSNGKSVTKIERLGLHIEIVDDEDLFDAQVWFDDRTAHTPAGHAYRACARLEVLVLLPESYTRYRDLQINGVVTDIRVNGLDKIKFGNVGFNADVGSVVATDTLSADEVTAVVKTGRVEIASVEAATESKPLKVVADVVTGHAAVHAKTKPANAAHDVLVQSNTGSVQVTVSPSSSSSSSSSDKPADLNIHASSKVGSVRAVVSLESRHQVLRLDAGSNTGSVSAQVSDDFSGHLRVETKLGSTYVKAVSGSESKIEYQKQTGQVKEGVKRFQGGESTEGHVELRSSLGRVALEFTRTK